MDITTSPSTTSIYEEGDKVSIKCSIDANPPPKLLLFQRDGDNTLALSEQFQIATEFEASISLTRDINGMAYFCRAEHTSEEYVLFSEEIMFRVNCMYYLICNTINVGVNCVHYLICNTINIRVNCMYYLICNNISPSSFVMLGGRGLRVDSSSTDW